MRLTADELIVLIKESLKASATKLSGIPKPKDGKKYIGPNKDWTKMIFIALAEQAHTHDYMVCGSKMEFADYVEKTGSKRGHSEWLYDHCWLIVDRNEIPARVVDIALVLESEWVPNKLQILDDFEKLMLARADLRVMLFKQSTEKRVNLMFDDLKHAVKKFKKAEIGDRYLFCGVDIASGRFIFEPHVVA